MLGEAAAGPRPSTQREAGYEMGVEPGATGWEAGRADGRTGEEIKDKRPVIKAVRGAQHSTGGTVSNPVIAAWRGGGAGLWGERPVRYNNVRSPCPTPEANILLAVIIISAHCHWKIN